MERTVAAHPRGQVGRIRPARFLRRADPPRPPGAELGGRLRVALLSLALAVQIAWLTLFGWAGAILTLLPIVLQGAPVGRRGTRRAPSLRLFTAPVPEDVAGP